MRLPTNLKPILYHLKLRPYLPFDNMSDAYSSLIFQYHGEIKTHFECLEPTDEIVFHSLNLEINSLRLESKKDSKIMLIDSIIYNSETDFVILHMNKKCVEEADYILSINYTGKILDELHGFYKSSYTFNDEKH
jgi:hypothetical protein